MYNEVGGGTATKTHTVWFSRCLPSELASLCLRHAYQSDHRCLGSGKLVQTQGELYFMASCLDLHPLGIHFQYYIKRG